MMELGATVCLPGEPRCLVCPVRQWCATQGDVPRKTAPPRQKQQEIWCALDQRAGRIRMVQRSKTTSLMAGMWELPQLAEAPVNGEAVRWRTFRHSITVTNYAVHVLRNPLKNGGKGSRRGKWIAIDKILQLPITGLTRKILKADGII
jgi:A/G-specific adenine glycosylase